MGDLEEISNDVTSSPESDDNDRILDEHEKMEKSKILYANKYQKFVDWRKTHLNTNSSTEDVLLEYFKCLSEKSLPSTLYSVYSILRKLILQEEQIDITSYFELKKFLSTNAKGFKSRKTEYFTAKNICDFINNAPDEKYLASKVKF